MKKASIIKFHCADYHEQQVVLGYLHNIFTGKKEYVDNDIVIRACIDSPEVEMAVSENSKLVDVEVF